MDKPDQAALRAQRLAALGPGVARYADPSTSLGY